ncbi:MAG: glycoside hydrolase family 1 protein [Omnitrophica WOR_2 bacterium]
MAQATFHFPRGFLWGTSTAAYQVEGNNSNNNWWAWEQTAGHIKEEHRCGLACDWWNGRWREDLDRAAEADQNAHRLSVEWSRIQPAIDRWDEDALDRYREMMQGLNERGLTPLVTLHHFSDPLWFYEMGGWENEKAPEYFEKFVRKVVEAFKEYVTLWTTINEPNNYAMLGYMIGWFPPGKHNLSDALKVARNLTRGHVAAYRAIHAIQPQARVGIVLIYQGFQAAKPWFPPDRLEAGLYNTIYNNLFLYAFSKGRFPRPLLTRIPEAKGALDFLGIDYYSRQSVAFNLRHADTGFGRRFYPEGTDISDDGFFANTPEGMYESLKWGRTLGIPMIVTENGINNADDSLRRRYIVEHIHQLWRAVNNNWPIKGYFHWTLVDNFEWDRGWTQRFGLWELDQETQVRRKRPSADLYAEICRENGLSYEMVAKYAPEVLEKIFP